MTLQLQLQCLQMFATSITANDRKHGYKTPLEAYKEALPQAIWIGKQHTCYHPWMSQAQFSRKINSPPPRQGLDGTQSRQNTSPRKKQRHCFFFWGLCFLFSSEFYFFNLDELYDRLNEGIDVYRPTWSIFCFVFEGARLWSYWFTAVEPDIKVLSFQFDHSTGGI